MYRIKFIVFAALLLLLTGCQHTSSKYSSVQKAYLNNIEASRTRIEAEAVIPEPDSAEENQVQITDPQPPLPDKTDDTPTLSDNTEKPDKLSTQSGRAAQEKIDQALELCNFAQKMWEKGKLEEALSNLDSAYFSILEIDPDISPEYNQQKEDIRYLISKRILEIYASRQIVLNGQHNEIPITLNRYVNNEIKRLLGPERKFFIQSLERSYRYRPMIIAQLKKAGLPEDISWLPLIESGFKIRALSSARALGLWQFIPSTGYKFGLNRNYYIDERLDPEKATKAAISYLSELHKLFGDWTTALAAYNCGESRVLRIIRKQRINYLDNFWDLYQNLPRETSRYVPRFLATLHIIKNLDKYNIRLKSPLTPIDYQFCDIKKQVRLKDIANEIGVDTGILRELNAELRYALLPPEQYRIKIPVDKAQLFLSKIDKIKTTYSPPPMYVFHRVRRGETVSGIAQKYKTTIRSICRVNNIRKSRIYAGKVLKIPSRSNGPYLSTASSNALSNGKTITYRVQQGDSLWNIARKFGTTTKHIMAMNNLSGTRLNIGQRLKISSGKQPVAAKEGAETYQVRSGDSPFTIAKKYKMSVNRLLAINDLNKRSKIFPGQQLIVE